MSEKKSDRIAMYCMDNPEHPMFKEVDGARCVECRGLINIKPVTEEQYRELPSYRQLREERKPKAKQSLSVAVNVNTDKLQRKLRAIAKHAEALVNELEDIDKEDSFTGERDGVQD